MKNQLKKIVVLGPESTGKSTLCKKLADHYQTSWVPEYARKFLEKNGREYQYDDLLEIAKEQLAHEKRVEATAKNGLLFIDTDMNVMRVWCEFVFGKCHDWILEQVAGNNYDLYLLCNIDLPWVEDELREYPDIETRSRLLKIYTDIMINQDIPWVLIEGDYQQRFEQAVEAVENLIA